MARKSTTTVSSVSTIRSNEPSGRVRTDPHAGLPSAETSTPTTGLPARSKTAPRTTPTEFRSATETSELIVPVGTPATRSTCGGEQTVGGLRTSHPMESQSRVVAVRSSAGIRQSGSSQFTKPSPSSSNMFPQAVSRADAQPERFSSTSPSQSSSSSLQVSVPGAPGVHEVCSEPATHVCSSSRMHSPSPQVPTTRSSPSSVSPSKSWSVPSHVSGLAASGTQSSTGFPATQVCVPVVMLGPDPQVTVSASSMAPSQSLSAPSHDSGAITASSSSMPSQSSSPPPQPSMVLVGTQQVGSAPGPSPASQV